LNFPSGAADPTLIGYSGRGIGAATGGGGGAAAGVCPATGAAGLGGAGRTTTCGTGVVGAGAGNQNLYVESPAIPGELGPAFELPVNCRNTVRIAEHCAGLVNQLNKVRDGAPIGDAPEFIRATNKRDAFSEAFLILLCVVQEDAAGKEIV
jgi:hypothetical protein